MSDFLSKNNHLLQESRSKHNWLIEDGDDPTCTIYAVYCSSNGIYFPNDEDTFIKRIVQQNKFDWKSNRIVGVKKHIYIRDVYKQWYIEGINNELNSIEKVADWIRSVSETNAKYVFLGSSAGGYMCLCLASILGGIAFAGSPQICLKPEPKYPILLEHYQKGDITWYDLSKILQASPAENFIFFGQENREDVAQIELVSQFDNVHVIPFRTSLHGVVFYPFNVMWFYSKRSLLRKIALKKKPQIRIVFSLRIAGVFNTIIYTIKALVRKIKR